MSTDAEKAEALLGALRHVPIAAADAAEWIEVADWLRGIAGQPVEPKRRRGRPPGQAEVRVIPHAHTDYGPGQTEVSQE